ncbi:MAG: hypothetical protein ACLPTJ_07145 [Solirubrobacteraceae bacterium]
MRHYQFGEGDYQQDEAAVRQLLYDAGTRDLPPPMTAHALVASAGLETPETYLNPQRAQGFAQQLKQGTNFYPGVIYPHLNEFGLHGIWNVGPESVTPASIGDSITGRFQAAHVYLVLTSAGNVPRRLRVLLDGHPISAADSGADVHDSYVTVKGQRLYGLISLPQAQQHTFTIQIPPGISAYDFTFG